MKTAFIRTIWLPAIALALLCCSCGGRFADPPQQRSDKLPRLPDDGPGWSRQVSETLVVPGSTTYMTSGEPGAATHPVQAEWLMLDGTLGGEMAWGIWQYPLPGDAAPENIRVNLQSSGFNRYWVFFADYDSRHWVLDAERTGTALIPVPGSGIRSPGNYVYMAIVVLAGQKINIGSTEFVHDGSGGEDPIFDQFEDNDTTFDAYQLAPGMHRASVHETLRIDMTDPNEWRDNWDFYRISLLNGQHLTATLRYERMNHFPPQLDFNDLDLLFYYGPTSEPLNDFIENLSSIRIYYHPFEQINYQAEGNFDIIIGIRGDIDGPKNDAEYDFGIHLSDAVYEVSGVVTQEEEPVDWDHVVFLEPGNFNAVTPFPPTGAFTITGVPDGTYTLKVHKSARDPQPPFDYVWPQSEIVVVNGGDISGVTIDIGPDP